MLSFPHIKLMKRLATIGLLVLIPLLTVTLQFAVFAEEVSLEEQTEGGTVESKEPESPDTVCYNFRLAGTAYKDLNDSGAYEESKDEILSGQTDLITVEGINVSYGPYTVSTYSAGIYSFGGLRTGTYRITGRDLEDRWITDSQELVVECPEPNYEYRVDVGYRLPIRPPTIEPLPDFTSSVEWYDYHDWEEWRNSTKLLDNWYPVNPGGVKTHFRPVAYIPNGYLSQIGRPSMTNAEIIAMMNTESQRVMANSERLIPGSDFVTLDPVVVRSSNTLNQIICGTPTPCENPDWGSLISAANRDYNEQSDETPIFFLFGGGGIALGFPPFVSIGDCGWDELLGYNVPTNQCAGIDGLVRFRYTILHELGHAIDIPWHSPPYASHPTYSFMSKHNDDSLTNLANHPGYPEKRIFCESSFNQGQKLCSGFAQPSRPPITSSAISGRLVANQCQIYNTNYKVGLYQYDPYNPDAGTTLLRSSSIDQNGAFTISLSGLNILGWQDHYRIHIDQSMPSTIDPSLIQGPEYYFNPTTNRLCDGNGSGTDCMPFNDLTFDHNSACQSVGGPFPSNTSVRASGQITCTSGTSTIILTNGRAQAQATRIVPSDIASTDSSGNYAVSISLPGYGNAYQYSMQFKQFIPGTSTVFSTVNVPFTVNSNGFPIINGQTLFPNQFHHNFTSCAGNAPPTVTSTPTPSPTTPPGGPLPQPIIHGGFLSPDQHRTWIHNADAIFGAGHTVKYIVNPPSNQHPDCGSAQWPDDYTLEVDCGSVIRARSFSQDCSRTSDTGYYTATAGCPAATPTNTPTPTAPVCVSSSITATLGIVEKADGSSTLMPNPGYEAALLLDHYQSSGQAPHYMEVVVHKTDVNNQSIGTQRVYERFLNQNPLDPNNTNLIRFTDWDRNVNWATTDVIFHYNQPVCGTNTTTKTQRVAPERSPITRIMGIPDTVTDPCVISGYFRSEAADFQNYLNFINGQIPTQSGVPITMEIYTGGYPAPYGNGQLMTLPNGQTQFSANVYRSNLATRWGSNYANHGYSLNLRNSPVANGSYQVLYLKLINPPNTVGETEYYTLPFRCSP